MDKQALIRKLDEGVTFLRDVIQDNDGSTLKALAASAKQGFDGLKNAFEHNEKAQKAVAEIKQHMEEMEEAIKKGDKKLSAKLLAAAEKKIQKYKEKFNDEAAVTPPGKKTAGAKKATKTGPTAKATKPTKSPAPKTAKTPAKSKSASTSAKPAKNAAKAKAPTKRTPAAKKS